MKKKILLVDDDPIFHFIHIKLIEQLGVDCDISTASNGANALQIINGFLADAASPPDIIFLDLNMPVMDGFEFIRALQKIEFLNQESVTIIVLTSSAHSEDVKKATDLGIRRFISKPLTQQDLFLIFNQ
jgi:CheY-like chemotaxis protein